MLDPARDSLASPFLGHLHIEGFPFEKNKNKKSTLNFRTTGPLLLWEEVPHQAQGYPPKVGKPPVLVSLPVPSCPSHVGIEHCPAFPFIALVTQIHLKLRRKGK